jgi:hypothetical protein
VFELRPAEDDGGVVLEEMRVFMRKPEANDEEDDKDGGDDVAPAEARYETLAKELTDAAGLGDSKEVCKLPELMFTTPRGKFIISIFEE